LRAVRVIVYANAPTSMMNMKFAKLTMPTSSEPVML
jgi:hypothetical protein